MLTIKLLPAEYGDCILISIDEKKSLNLLIDGGTGKTYESFIKEELKQIKEAGQILNLVICTHMDYDHISGLIGVLEHEDADFIKEIWYNGFLQVINREYYSLQDNKRTDRDNQILDEVIALGTLPEDDREAGINDGMSLGILISQKNISLNTISAGSAISSLLIVKQIQLGENTTIRVIGPSKEELGRLEENWKREMIARNYTFRVSNKMKLTEAFEYQSQAIKMHYVDAGVPVSESEELEKYMGGLEVTDESVTNASSISFILEHNSKKYLFLGDAVMDDSLLERIELIVGHEYKFKAIKLPHHGSRYNITLDFIKRYTAEEYYCLTNTKRFSHPDLEVLTTIICQNPEHKKMIFNYPIEKARFLDKNEWKEKYNYEVITGDGDFAVERTFV